MIANQSPPREKALPLTSTEYLLQQIDTAITGHEHLFTQIGYRYGVSGLSLYHFAVGRFFNDESHTAKANACLEKAFDMLNDGYVSGGLYKELAEIGWFLENCKKHGYYAGDTNEVLNDIDEMLYTEMRMELDKRNFDPVTGALAYGYYFLHRLPSNPDRLPYIIELCEGIKSLSFENEQGLYWKSRLKGDDSIYLGISHGIANIILFFIMAEEGGALTDARPLITKAAAFIRNNRYQEGPLLFPIILGEVNDTKVYPNSWCYGDLGTVYALLKAGIFLNDEALRKEAETLLAQLATRESLPPYLDAGPGLLYGHCGVAALFYHAGDLTGDPIFTARAKKLMKDVQATYNPEDEFLGYRGYWNQDVPYVNYSFIEGLIGIALSLMAEKDREHRRFFQSFFYLS